jgi:large subunit ribosomal protein L36e
LARSIIIIIHRCAGMTVDDKKVHADSFTDKHWLILFYGFVYINLTRHSFHSYIQKLSKRTSLAREIVREVVGLSPYERRILDMIKTGGSSADKRIYKYAKKRLGSHKRAVQKREDIKGVNAKQRARQAGIGA